MPDYERLLEQANEIERKQKTKELKEFLVWISQQSDFGYSGYDALIERYLEEKKNAF